MYLLKNRYQCEEFDGVYSTCTLTNLFLNAALFAINYVKETSFTIADSVDGSIFFIANSTFMISYLHTNILEQTATKKLKWFGHNEIMSEDTLVRKFLGLDSFIKNMWMT